MQITYEFLKEKGLILFEAVTGSQAYGTSTPTSDIDRKFIYILPKENILGVEYVEQIQVSKDFEGFEIRRFLELLQVNNPNMMEFIGDYPEECIVFKHPLFDLILQNKDKFISKKCGQSFGGYATDQIYKAQGMNKKQNWEKKRITRKTPIDFCYAIEGEKSIPLKKWLKSHEMDSIFAGLTKIPHTHNNYSLFYDHTAAKIFSESLFSEKERSKLKKEKIESGAIMGLGYKGIETPKSTKIRLSSIPKGEKSMVIISYNENAYAVHCKEYKSYTVWLKKRNKTRWTDVKEHGQAIDGKNMLHCIRLIEMAKEIGQGLGVNTRRPNPQALLDIRYGKVPLNELIQHAKEEIKEIKLLFQNSNLPKVVDRKFIHNLLVEIRNEFYAEYCLTY